MKYRITAIDLVEDIYSVEQRVWFWWKQMGVGTQQQCMEALSKIPGSGITKIPTEYLNPPKDHKPLETKPL